MGATSSAAGLVQKTLVDLKYPGIIYHTHGAATKELPPLSPARPAKGPSRRRDRARLIGISPRRTPSKTVGLTFVKAYEGKKWGWHPYAIGWATCTMFADTAKGDPGCTVKA